MLRFLRRLPRRTVQGLLALVLLLAIAVFAVTRTQVGRDALARSLESEFAQTFTGTLRIGRLTGNLMREFVATDITVRDSTGRESLRIDSLMLRTSWEDLIRRRVVIPRIVVIRPSVEVVVDDSGKVSVRGLESRARRADSTEGLFRFRSARVAVVDGTVRSLPADSSHRARTNPRTAFDPTDVEVASVRLDALLDWTAAQRQIDLFAFSADAIRPRLAIRSLETQIVMSDERIAVNRGRLRLEETDLSVEATLFPGTSEGRRYDLLLDAPVVSFDEIASLWPASPLGGRGSLLLDVSGTGSELTVARADFTAGGSRASISGRATGSPDRLAFDLSADRVRLRSRDLRTLLPDMPPVARARFDSLFLSGHATGRARLDGWTVDSLVADGSLAMGGSPGSISTTFSVDLGDRRVPRIALDADATALDISAFVPGVPTRLTGRIELATIGIEPRSMTGSARIELEASRVGPRRVRHAVAQARADGPGLRFDVAVETDDRGWLRTDGLWTRDSLGTLSADAAWSRFDFGPLVGRDSLVTDASGTLSLLFSGSAEPDIAGRLRIEIDSSRVVARNDSTTVLPQSIEVLVARAGTERPRIDVRGDAFDARITGDVRLGALTATGAFWIEAISGAVRRELDKPYPGLPPPSEAALLENARDIRATVLRGQATEALARIGAARGLDLRVGLEIKQPPLIDSWWPGIPDMAGSVQIFADASADADSLRLSLSMAGDSLTVGGLRLVQPRGTVDFATAFEAPVERSAVLSLVLAADSVVTGRLRLPDLRVEGTLADRGAGLSIASGRHADIGPLGFEADLTLLDDRNRIVVRTASIAARNYAWALENASTVDWYAGGVRVDEFRFQSGFSELFGRQAVEIRGALSDQPSDTLFVYAEGVRLEDVTTFGSLKPAFGGRLDGRAAFTRADGRPLLQSDLTATGLVMDERLLGHLTARSRLEPGSPDIAVALELVPADTAGLAWRERPRENRHNRLEMDGSIRLPVDRVNDSGAWDLNLRVGRADLFFLKYIFNETLADVSGYLAGDGTVTGAFDRPVFDFEFDAYDGRFSIPVTGVTYTLEGELGIDRDAIFFRRVTVGDPDGGRAIVAGDLLFNEYQYFSFDLEAVLEELLIIDTGYTEDLPFYGTIRGSGTATLSGPLAAAHLNIPDGITRQDSDLYIPIVESTASTDDSFIIFADSTGELPDVRQLQRRSFLLAGRASAERRFLDGLGMEINLFAPRGSVIHLVIDPLLGDVINAVSTGRVQIRRDQGEFEIFGELEVEGGDYLFTAGEVFVRRFIIEEGGTLTWDSDPIDARLNIPAVYRTRASGAGLDIAGANSGALIPIIVHLQIAGRVLTPSVALSLSIDRTNQNVLGDYQALEARLNNPERAAEYATSVLLTNSFQLTTENLDSRTGEQLAFNSVSQLVSAQLNRFLNAAIPNVDVSLGLQGERASDLDITYGVALRLLDERLIIRGEGVYQGSRTDASNVASESIQGEFVVEVRLSPTVSVQVFFRREGDVFQSTELTNTTGAGVSYQTEFPTWRRLWNRLFGWLSPGDGRDGADAPSATR